MKTKIFIAAAVLISSQLYAQESNKITLDEVVVTATKTPIKQSQTGKVVSVIDQATLQNNVGKTLTEILNYQAGIYINGANNNLGTNQDVYLRGSSSGNTLILIDGIPVSDPSQIDNSYDLNNINPAQVERIEILKGAQSTLWGSDAVAGVINIITKKGAADKITPTAGISYGSFHTFKANAGLNGKLNKFTYNVNYNHTESVGFPAAYDTTGKAGFANDPFRQNNVQANLGYSFSPKFTLTAMSSYANYKTGLPAGAFTDQKNYNATNTSFINSAALVYKTKGATQQFTNTLINSKRGLLSDSSKVNGNINYTNAMYKGNSFVSELFGNFSLAKKLSLVAGAQRTAQNTDQHYLNISNYGPYETSLGKDSAKTTNYAAYASLLLVDISGFNAEAGIRYNNHSIYGNNVTYSFNPSYNIDENTKVFVNISSAFKVPSLYQLYSDYGNKGLQPEKSNNYEIGVQSFSNNKKNSLRFVGFKRDIKNLIVFADLNVPPYGQYLNRDQQNDYGFEVESNIAIAKTGNWVNNVTYVDGQGMSNNVAVKNFYRRPNFTFNSALTLHPIKSLTVVPAFRFVGSRLKGTYDAGPAFMPQYYTVDLFTAYNFTKQLRAFVDLRNITNQQYFDVVGYTSKRFNFNVGLSANF